MDPRDTKNPERTKMRFKPKAPKNPPRRHGDVKKEEPADEADEARKAKLMRQFHEAGGSLARRNKYENKSTPAQVPFGHDAGTLKSYGSRQTSTNYKGSGGSTSSVPAEAKEYQEPWDYYSDYPVSFPLRPPYSGDPETLDEAEFGVTAQNTPYDEDSIKSATELGLTEQNQATNMFFFQLPSIMPTAAADGTNTDSKNPSSRAEKPCKFEELPEGFMGKMLVYKSGKVKLKLGDTLYDVSPGVDCSFAQEAVAINTEEKSFSVMGELNKRVVVVPDIDSILKSI